MKKKTNEDECFEANEEESEEVTKTKNGTIQSFVGKAKQTTMNSMIKERDPVIRSICRCLNL